MSENTNEQATNQNVAEETKREPFRIGCVQKEEWIGTASSKFISSIDLCEMINDAFAGAFYDFQGSTLEIPQQQGMFIPTIALHFNHNEPAPGETRIAGVTRNDGSIKEGTNVTRNAVRQYNHTVSNADKYYLTQEAKEAIEEYLVDSKNIHKKGDFSRDIDWGKIVTPVAQRNNYGFVVGNQMTKVSWIDPGKFFSETYAGGEKFVYVVHVISSLPYDRRHPTIPNYMLNVLRLHVDQVNELGVIFGLGYAGNGLDIVSV